MKTVRATILTLLLEEDGQHSLLLRWKVSATLGRSLSPTRFEDAVTALEGEGLLVKRPPTTWADLLTACRSVRRILRQPPEQWNRKAIEKRADRCRCRLTAAGRIVAIARCLEPLVPKRGQRLVKQLLAAAKAAASDGAARRPRSAA